VTVDNCLIFIGERIEAFFGPKQFVWKTPRTIESLDSQVVRSSKFNKMLDTRVVEALMVHCLNIEK